MMRVLIISALAVVLAAACSDSGTSTKPDGNAKADAVRDGTSDSPASDGPAGDGPTSDGPAGGCAVGAAKVELRAPSGSAKTYCTNFCNNWLSFRDTKGGPAFRQGNIMDCMPSCSDCKPVGCPGAACIDNPLPAAGLKATWKGGYVVSDKCNGSTSCHAARCVPAGRYVAVMCAKEATGPTEEPCRTVATTPTCVEVELDFPNTTTTVGTLK